MLKHHKWNTISLTQFMMFRLRYKKTTDCFKNKKKIVLDITSILSFL